MSNAILDKCEKISWDSVGFTVILYYTKINFNMSFFVDDALLCNYFAGNKYTQLLFLIIKYMSCMRE